jgi:hypothetical protein
MKLAEENHIGIHERVHYLVDRSRLAFAREYREFPFRQLGKSGNGKDKDEKRG